MINARVAKAYGHRHQTYRLGLAVIFLWTVGCVEMRAPDPAVRYIAFGNSTTKGPSTRDYPDILRELLGEPPEVFANEGAGGETSEEGVVRLNDLLSYGIFPNAEVLLFWQGGSDLTDFIKDYDPFLVFPSPDDPDYWFDDDLTEQLDETQANIESAIACAQNAGLVVYVSTYFFLRENIAECDPLPLNILLPPQAVNANAYLARLNERIREAVADRGAILVDVGAEDEVIRADQANYFNCNHLSEQGNEIVAELFFDAITATAD